MPGEDEDMDVLGVPDRWDNEAHLGSEGMQWPGLEGVWLIGSDGSVSLSNELRLSRLGAHTGSYVYTALLLRNLQGATSSPPVQGGPGQCSSMGTESVVVKPGATVQWTTRQGSHDSCTSWTAAYWPCLLAAAGLWQ
mmetsp:Transcript_110651/g.308272  ORF Transcript_110651/g.308272 Transcript_110651/m.308272 type:complete len:137 (+) Transcript_110651:524-934(+)